MWYTENGNMGDVVLSTRVRLARNIASIPFAPRMTKKNQGEVIEKCRKAFEGDKDMKFIDISAMRDYERQALAEKHIISPEMVSSTRKTGLLLSGDERAAIMLNEEDHIRIQYMSSGLDKSCLAEANRLDDKLEASVDFAFDPQIGYLTCCPTNVGTGMRASVMVFLPAMVMSNNADRIFRSLSTLGMTVRGLYGEGSNSAGNIFQISNQVTLGVSEEEIWNKLEQITGEIVEKERELRKKLYESSKYETEDRVLRSLGILTNARLMSGQEALARLSDVRLGISLGIIEGVSVEKLNDVMYRIFPATIVNTFNIFSARERDLKRAEITKELTKAPCSDGLNGSDGSDKENKTAECAEQGDDLNA